MYPMSCKYTTKTGGGDGNTWLKVTRSVSLFTYPGSIYQWIAFLPFARESCRDRQGPPAVEEALNIYPEYLENAFLPVIVAQLVHGREKI